MIKKKLMERRLPKELIERKLSELVTPEAELGIANRLLKKLVKNNKPDPETDRAKLFHRLRTRGFRSEAIIAATKILK